MTAVVREREGNLLRLARALVQPEASTELTRLLVEPVRAPNILGETARRLLGDALSQGVVLGLARNGGWRKEAGRRLWEREPPPLKFTGNVVRLLQWLLSTRLGAADVAPLQVEGPLTEAEECVVVLLLERVSAQVPMPVLLRQPALRASPLAVLAFAAEFARQAPLSAVPALRASHAPYLHGLSTILEARWLAAERSKRGVERPDVLRRIGDAQDQVLQAFLTAVEAPGRRGLATWLVRVGAQFLSVPRRPADYADGLSPTAPLRERAEAVRAAAAVMRGLAVVQRWDAEHRTRRFIDDHYDEAQRLIREWEVLGDRGFRAAAALVTQCEQPV